ncbi:38455_t:CDS:2, partial [Gigaspora margarita]
APGKNRWVISPEAKPEQEFEVVASHIKFVGFSTTSAGENREAINTSNVNSIQWNNEIVTIDARQVFRSYTHAPVVHIADITNVILDIKWNDLTWMEFIRFIGILTIITYVKCADICDYWSIRQETNGVLFDFSQYMSHQRFQNIIKYITLTDITANDDPFYFAQRFHNEFNENLAKANLPGSYLCIDKSMCQWMAIADTRANLLLGLDPVEPSEYAIKKNFRLVSTNYGCIALYKHGLYSILQIKKRHYWPKNIPHDITGALENAYRSF